MGPADPRSPRAPGLPRGVGRNVLVLGLVSLLTDVGSEMLYAVVPLYLTTVLGAPMTIVGIIEGVAESTASLLKLGSGWASDRLRRRLPFVIAGYALSALSRPLLALTGSWSGVLGARIVDRTGKGLRGPARDALIAASTPPRHHGVAFGFHRALDTVGAVLGPLVAFVGLAWIGLSFRQIFWLATVPAMAAVLCLVGLRVRDHVPERSATDAPSGPVAPLSPALRRYLLVTAVFALGNSSNVFLLLRARDLGWGDSEVIGLYVLYNAVYALAATPAGRLSDRLGHQRVLALGMLIFSLAYAGLALAGSRPVAAALLLGYGLYSAALGSAGRAFVADLSDEATRGRAMGAYQAVTGAVLLVASPIAGLLWSHVGPAAPFWFGAATAAISAPLLVWFCPASSRPARR